MGWAHSVRVGWIGLGMMVMGCGGGPGSPDAAAPAEDGASEPVDAPRLDAADPDGGADAGSAGGPTRTSITAAEGGTARSADGLFEIIVSPGSLAEDTEIVIERLDSSAVPADVMATDPVSAVYAVEPDGLTFGGDGAIVHYHFDVAPSTLLDGTRHAAAFAAARAADGGAITWHGEPAALYEGTALDIAARIAHLSYQWATGRDERGHDHFLGVVFDDTHTPSVGDHWSPTIDVQSSDSLSSAIVGRYALHRAVSVERAPGGTESVLGSGNATIAFRLGDRSVAFGVTEAVPGPFVADRPSVARPTPRFFCSEAGRDSIAIGAELFTSVGEHVRVVVLDPEETECVEAPVVRASILDTIDCERRGDAIDCSATPVAEPVVTALPASVTTVNLADSPWFVILAPAADPPAPGPATLTATNSGATMTATRTPTGSYDASIDAPLLWGPSAETRWSASGASATTRGPDDAPPTWGTPGASCDFGLLAEDPSWEIAVHPPPTVTCRGLDFVDAIVGRPAVVDLGDGTRGFDAPIRDLLDRTASYCEISPDALTGTGWYLEIRATSSATLDAGGTQVAVRTGTALRIDGAALVASCPAGRTYCTDRCVDTATDPMNCGGCGLAPLEVCDGVDNDCDGMDDESCPIGITLPGAGDPVSSAMFGDTTSPTFGLSSGGCMAMPMIGLCGSTNPDGTLSSLDVVCGNPTVERRGTDTFEVLFTESLLGGTSCEAGTVVPTGGAVWSARCPANMVVDGVSGLAPTTGRIGQVSVRCSQWTLAQDATRGWVVRRDTTATAGPGGTGPGTAFAYTMPDRSSDGFPGMLRSRRARYQVGGPSTAGIYWISVAGNYPIVRYF